MQAGSQAQGCDNRPTNEPVVHDLPSTGMASATAASPTKASMHIPDPETLVCLGIQHIPQYCQAVFVYLHIPDYLECHFVRCCGCFCMCGLLQLAASAMLTAGRAACSNTHPDTTGISADTECGGPFRREGQDRCVSTSSCSPAKSVE